MTAQPYPSPWRLGLTDDTVIVDAQGTPVASVMGDYDDTDVWPVMEATARLIVAAPDLLAALNAVLRDGVTTASTKLAINAVATAEVRATSIESTPGVSST